VAFRQIDLRTYFLKEVAQVLAGGLRYGIYPEGVPAELEPILWQLIEDQLHDFTAGKLKADLAKDILTIWGGKTDPREAWDRVVDQLDPALRIRGAFILGRRLVVLQKPEWAEFLLQEVAQGPDPILKRQAVEELKKIQEQKGK